MKYPTLRTKTLSGFSSIVKLSYSKRKHILFDCGPVYDSALVNCGIIFLTHCHLDHFSNIFFHARYRAQNLLPPPTIYVPAENIVSLTQMAVLSGELDGKAAKINFVAVNEGGKYIIEDTCIVEAFRTTHKVPSFGYTVKRSVGNDEFLDLLITGDTSRDLLENSMFLSKLEKPWKFAVLECTALSNDSKVIEKTRERMHLCSADISNVSNSLKLPNYIVLVHFSSRYKVTEIIADLSSKFPKDFHGKIFPDISFLFSLRELENIEINSEVGLSSLENLKCETNHLNSETLK